MRFFERNEILSPSLQRFRLSVSFPKYFIVLTLFLVALSANATDYYVSNNGNDSKTGTSPEQAWKTLDKVNSFMPQPDDKILFNRGDEWVGTINVNASGRLGSNIVYGAYGSGSKPKFYGSKIVSGWTKHSGNIYKAKINASKITQVFLNDVPANSARYPNNGYFTISKAGKVSLSSSEIDGSINYAGAVACVRTREWYISTQTVSRSSGQTITLPSEPMYGIDKNEGFFLFNKLEFLDKAGEWYFDDTNNVLYVWAPNGDSPANYLVRASTVDNIIEASSKSYVTIQNLELLHAKKYGVYINSSDYINLDNLDIKFADQIGVEISSTGSSFCTLTNSTIDNSSYFGYRSSGNNHLVSDNRITNIGLMSDLGVSGTNGQSGAGIYFRYGNTGNNTAKYNTIKNVGYNGIWFWDCPHTTIEYNYIYGACLTIEDGGGIYCYESSTAGEDSDNSVIRYNIIDFVPGNGEGYTATRRQGDGIYTDDRISHVTIENNTVTRASHYAMYLHNNKYITVKNNTFFDNGSAYRATGAYNAKGNVLENNIIMNIASSQFSGYLGLLNPKENSIITIDNNTYIDHHRDKPFGDMSDYSYKTFSEWKSIVKHDANSRFIGSPLADGETEKLFYNDTKNSEKINFGSTVYRDIYGNTVSGSITLEPFTSKILIKTNSESSSSNNSPSIQDQIFEKTGDLILNEFIGQVVASDPDNGQTLTYSIISGNEEGLFYIDSATGEIYSSSDVQITQDKSIALTVEVTDDTLEPLSASATIAINITAASNTETTTQNHFPAIKNQTFNLTGNLSLHQSVSQVIASDPDEGQTLNYSIISGNDDGLFYIDSTTGQILSATVTQINQDKTVVLTVEVSDDDANPLSASANISINITATSNTETTTPNHFPSIENQSFNLTGNLTLNQFIGQINASDPNDGQTLTYSIISGNEKGLFYINSATGEIYSSSDLQITQDKLVILNVEVTDDDASPLSASANISINVNATSNPETNNKNQFPILENQSFYLSGNLSLNQFIGQINASDPDNGQNITYSIKNGNSESLFHLESNSGKIYSQKNLEITEEKTYILHIEVTDNSSSPLSSSASITINLTPSISNNIDDYAPPIITLFEIPSTNYGYEVPILEFLATDNSNVTKYALSISPEAPLLNDTKWESTVPASYIFMNEGVRVLYAWAKDAAGNISAMASDTVDIVLPDLSPSFSEYLFEENDSTIVIDSQSNNIGNILNEEIRTEGINGKGLEFTGLGHINLGKSFGDNIKDEVTLSAWIKPTLDSTSSGYQGIIMHGGPNIDTYALYIYPNQKRIAFKTTGTSSEWTYAENIDALWDGEWHFLTATYDGSEKKIFLDNILIKDIPATGGIDFGPDHNLLIGAGRDKIPSSLFYEGTIDEVRIYNYALTTSEILNLYALSAPKKTMLTEEDIFICQGQDYLGWNESGEYYRTLESETGGDSIVITNLFVGPGYNINEEIVIQEGENYEGWTNTGLYHRTITSGEGCDSIVNTNLYVCPKYEITEDITIKEGESYNGWKESGQYQRTLATVRGCDSIVTTNLKVITQSFYSEYQFEEVSGTTVIDSKGFNNGIILNEELRLNGFTGKGLQFTGSGYINLGQTFGNIQNEVTLSAWILPDDTSTGYQGIIMHGGPNIDTYALYINPDIQRVAFKTTGTSAFWSYKDNVSKLWDGNWHHLAVTYDGAEKIVYLDNEVILKTASTGSIESGEGYNLMIAAGRDKASPTILYEGLIDEVRIYNYAITGAEISKLYQMAGTDTVYTEVDVEICDGENYKGWTQSGQYERIIESSTGADSIITTNLTVRPTYNISEDITIYEGENYEGWTEPGQYQRILSTIFGCDSIVVTNLKVEQTDTISNTPSSYYEWSFEDRYRRDSNDSADSLDLNYDTKAAKIGFANGRTSYTQQPRLVQNYKFKIYPNPAKSYITIEHDFHPSLNTQIEILNIKGISVFKRSLSQINGKLSLTNIPKGIYFVQLSNAQWKDSQKLVVM